ncbi:MAG: aminotransferase class V-fold PLP-dependent enzyme [Cyanobacteria bacterium]|nr:aminotransferase class V-fold PLP-dependent enzyme [Cyanobacteriota bacterium]
MSKPFHYLDNAATSWPKPEVVYRTLDQSFRQMFSPKRGTVHTQVHTPKHNPSLSDALSLDECRQVMATFIQAKNPQRIAFTNGCTHALNLAVQAFPWQPGDGVIISAVEHHALSRPVRKMAREKGIHFHVVPYSDAVPFDLGHYENLLVNNPIKLVATTHASNVIGCILPISEIGALAHHYGAKYLVDAAQSAGFLPIDVEAMKIDMLAFPGHKSLYGPPGVGVLYVDESVSLNTFMEGGTGGDSGKHEMHATVPDGLEVGTIALPLIRAMAAGCSWVQQEELAQIQQQERALLKRLLEGMAQIPEVIVYGTQDAAQKTPVVSFNFRQANHIIMPPKELGALLTDQFGIALRAGFHCAVMAHEAIGSAQHRGTVRASIGHFTQTNDIDALLNALTLLAQQQRSAPAVSHH